MEKIILINLVIAIIFCICYSYQFLYVIVSLMKKDKPHQETKAHRFAVLIAARNEETVINHLIDSINTQTYDQGEVTVFVVADNCTDQTAACARKMGAIVYERFDQTKIGKGHAMEFLLNQMEKDYAPFDGYFVFDADNVLDQNYILEMNKTFSDGYDIITSYRNSKNYGDNWISSGYAIWFLWESEFLNRGRMLLGTSCAVSGTGFFFSRRIIEKYGGWKFFLLTEDIQFTVDNVLSGEKIGYCRQAMLYDEQPVKFQQSFRQRMRWAKGFFQVFHRYGLDLFKGSLQRNTSCYDMLMVIMPAIILTLFTLIFNGSMILFGNYTNSQDDLIMMMMGRMILNMYLMLVFIATVTTATQWKNIHTTSFKKVAYIFTFPFFMFTYIPITIVAFFKKVEWQPIEHSRAKTLAEIKEG
ncbi:glycosyltransferase family 2 protein [Turicibacter bilis]|uniref:glycosyltransferase family 2 protein n=1 Tax=Turicibacter bilis TaxID=2735723 RepID=UPI0006C19D0B|nr:Poly-beta-1%2C6-N-acetyl-D-glucosamine synthase [Turicibacter sanguinis]